MHFFINLDLVRALLIAILLYLAYVDLRTFRLPDAITIPLSAAGLVLNYLFDIGLTDFSNAVLGAIFGYAFLWSLNAAYHRLKKQNAIGMGDAKLLAALGAWFGLSALPSILLMASITGLVGGLVWLRLKEQSFHAAFPFGPFLAIAGIIELLWPQLLPTLVLNNPI